MTQTPHGIRAVPPCRFTHTQPFTLASLTLLLNSQQVPINHRHSCQLHAVGRVLFQTASPPTSGWRPLSAHGRPAPQVTGATSELRTSRVPRGGLTELGKPGAVGVLMSALQPLCSHCLLVTRPLMHCEGEVPAPQGLCAVFVFCLILQKDCKALTPGFNPRDRTQVSYIS